MNRITEFALAAGVLLLAGCGPGATVGLVGGPVGVVAGAVIGGGAGAITETSTNAKRGQSG
jgi:hypothetical protein